jgi:putative SOS response-associated peptidase YedK
MCDSYKLDASPRLLAARFQVPRDVPELPFEGHLFNIAPSQQVPIVRQGKDAREMALGRWGLIPYWAKDAKIGYSLINARADTVAEKPAFRSAFKRRRCLIPADGFYEWQATGTKVKQPYFIRMKDQEPFAFAGLWEEWTAPEGEAVQSCSIITTDPNELMKPIHNRMPAILSANNYTTWLDPEELPDTLKGLLHPYDPVQMEAYPVSTFVNRPINQGPKCIEPLEMTA